MTVIQKKELIEEYIDCDIICNWCGQSCIKEGTPEHLHGRAAWGYGSHKDCTEWSFDLCETCSDALDILMRHGIDKRDISVDGTPEGEWHKEEVSPSLDEEK